MQAKSSQVFFFKWIFISSLVLLCSLYGLGFGYFDKLTAKNNFDLFHGIYHDLWVEQGANISLPNLGPGNRLEITWNDWLPANTTPSLAKILACGNQIAELAVVPGQTSVVNLPATCSPLIVHFDFASPFIASANDPRVVGAQLKLVQVTSMFRVPIVKVSWILSSIIFTFILALVINNALSRQSYLNSLVIASLSQLLFLSLAQNLEYTNMFYAFGTILVIILGYTLKTEGNSKSSNSNFCDLMMVAIILFALVVRLYGINFGLPHIYHPDEFQKYKAVMRMLEHGDLNPRYFWHPSGLLYSTYFMNTLVQLFTNQDFADTLILSGRLVSCLAGVLTVLLVFLIAKQFFSKTVGVWAAAILAATPLHIACSRYLKEDALLTFFILLSIYLTVIATRQKNWILLTLAGLTSGFSASIKYSGAVTALILLAYPWFNLDRLRLSLNSIAKTALIIILVPLGFLIISPYSLLDFSTFIEDFNHEREHMLVGHSSYISAGSQLWMFHLSRSIIPGFGWVATVLALFSLGALLKRDFKLAMFMAGLILLYYLPAEFVRAKPAPQPERYIVPCLPILAILAASLITARSQLVRIFVMLMILISIFSSGYRSITLASEIPNDTRDQLATWMLANIPGGSKVLIDWQQYGPQFKESPFEIINLDPNTVIVDLNEINKGRGKADYLVLSSLHYSRYFSMPNSNPAFRQVIRDVFLRHKKLIEFAPKYGTYGFHNPKLVLFKLSRK